MQQFWQQIPSLLLSQAQIEKCQIKQMVGEQLPSLSSVPGLVDVMAHGLQGGAHRPAQTRFVVDEKDVHYFIMPAREDEILTVSAAGGDAARPRDEIPGGPVCPQR